MILVTGASGCLGSHIVRALLDCGEKVAALKLAGDPAWQLRDVESRIEWRIGDLRDPASLATALQGMDSIYHAAGLSTPRPRDHQAMMEVNAEGTRRLLQAAQEAGVQRVVHISSIAAVGYPHAPADGRADETMAYNGASISYPYMHSKHAAEAIVRDFVTGGMDIVIVCPAAVIASGCDPQHGWGRIMLDIASGRLKAIPPGGISFIGHHDLAMGALAAMARGRSGERYILSSGDVRYCQLITAIANAAGVPPPGLILPPALLRGAARVLGHLEPLLNALLPDMRMTPGILELLWREKYYDIRKARAELGFVPRQSLADAVTEAWRWLHLRSPKETSR
ncbi:SDR family NAD(P)-dependent oxidoreductase [Chromobacterium sphagni]|uniref:NAD-dependent epimerase/dehydratase domain-containing protein n=1 Tax=Chromobacterium sphagni TaxID=1903179 RepID=A0ABX3CHW7_9NEIS|nr:SDR family NAD(P)-dependent oxidoreductase [Chromobacterium sphagni]OHX21937.1 hypothetical protein BI344_05410 [Chromobacterium sphagni]